MKVILLIMSVVMSAPTFAKTFELTSDADKINGDLQPYAEQFVAVLRNSGAPFVDLGKGIYTIGVQGLHCDTYGNGHIDSELPDYLVQRTECRLGALNEKATKTGREFQTGLALSDLINRLQSDIYADSDVAFVDCAMGYCGTYAKTVECWVDTKIPNISSGRFTCRLDDGY